MSCDFEANGILVTACLGQNGCLPMTVPSASLYSLGTSTDPIPLALMKAFTMQVLEFAYGGDASGVAHLGAPLNERLLRVRMKWTRVRTFGGFLDTQSPECLQMLVKGQTQRSRRGQP